MRRIMASLVFLVVLVLPVSRACAMDAAHALQGMTGYTIILADTLEKVLESDGDKYVKLMGGQMFKVRFLLLNPLCMTNVIVFAKPIPNEIAQQYRGKVPERFLYSYKLLINDETYDATPE